MRATPLVLTLSGIMNGLVRETITDEDLAQAVFFIEPFAHRTTLKREIRGAIYTDRIKEQACNVFVAALQKAEQEGRVAWRNDAKGGKIWEQLNELLRRRGLPTITPINRDIPQSDRYAHPLVAIAVEEQRLPFRVIHV